MLTEALFTELSSAVQLGNTSTQSWRDSRSILPPSNKKRCAHSSTSSPDYILGMTVARSCEPR